ncbi:MAG: hypothetical protein EXR79_06995 [Myxococcales bacterium]|nr:hypothetical protein [Myxococcales bacterium]
MTAPLLRALVSAACAGAIACAVVVPPDIEFAAGRCTTLLDDGVDGAPTFDLGAILQLTRPDGTAEPTGAFYLSAMRLALAEWNNNRYVGGRRFRVRVCDTRADWSVGGGQATRDLATWLTLHAGVQAVLADASSDTQTMQAVTVPRGVLVMAISATSAELTHLDDKGLVWRVAPSDVYQGAVLAHLASAAAGSAGRITVLAVQNPYGDGLVDALGKNLGTRLTVHTFGSDGGGLQKAVEAANGDAPKSLIVIATPKLAVGAARLRSQQAALAGAALWFADGACDDSVASQPLADGVSFAGVHCTRPGEPPTPTYEAFRERFKKRFSVDPVQSAYTQHAYDALYCVALAHAWAVGKQGAAKVDGAALAEGLRHLAGPGASQPLKPGDITQLAAALGRGEDVNVVGASGALDFNPKTGEAPSGFEEWTLGTKGDLVSRRWFDVYDDGKGTHVVLPVSVTGT